MIGSATITQAQADDVMAGLWYVNIHTDANPSGEIRGQVFQRLRPTLFANNACTLDAAGSLYIGGGNSNGEEGVNTGAIYKYSIEDPCVGQLCGDANCDGVFNGADIDAFFLALGDPAAWQTAYPDCNRVCAADINYDGAVNGADIDPFFAALGAGACPPAP
jgi:hypothetical protein